LPLQVDETITPDQNSNFCPEPVINGGDRLNVVQIPAESDNSSIVSPHSSTKYRGMLVFPVSSPQVNMPFSTANLVNRSAYSNVNDESLKSSNSIKGSIIFEPEKSFVNDTNPVKSIVDDNVKYESEKRDEVSAGRVSTGIATIFPDWISSLHLHSQKDSECDVNGEENHTPYLAYTLAMLVIQSFYPVMLCKRLAQGQPKNNEQEEDGTSIIYEGYQPGNVTASATLLSDLVLVPVLSIPLMLYQERENELENEDTILSISDAKSPEVSPIKYCETNERLSKLIPLTRVPSSEQRKCVR
jgi:hypothetical protein